MKQSFFYLTFCCFTVFYIGLSSFNKLAEKANQKDYESQIAVDDPSTVYPQLSFVYDWRGKFIDNFFKLTPFTERLLTFEQSMPILSECFH